MYELTIEDKKHINKYIEENQMATLSAEDVYNFYNKMFNGQIIYISSTDNKFTFQMHFKHGINRQTDNRFSILWPSTDEQYPVRIE